jgi:ABC-type nitrate/sulfonate/bicarbonate transport system substrate-binding protein
VARDFIQAYVEGVKFFNQRGSKDAEVVATHREAHQAHARDRAGVDPRIPRSGARPRVPDLAALQDWFHTMGWVKDKVPMERLVDLSFLQ